MAGPGATYRIRIHYREPSFELRAGPQARPFHWTYFITAADPESAKGLALEEFRQMAQASGVGWVRQILLVELDGEAA
jgi:hypothetical protein